MKKITYQHKKGKGASVSAETAERKRMEKAKKGLQPAGNQKKEG